MPQEIKVLFLLFPKFDTLDLNGPAEVLGKAGNDKIKFQITIASRTEETQTFEGITIKRNKSFSEALNCLSDFDILFQPGAGPDKIKNYRNDTPAWEEHLQIISSFSKLGPCQLGPRVLMSICTGALLVGSAGAFNGLKATTHYAALELLREWTEGNATIVPELNGGTATTEAGRIQNSFSTGQEQLVRWVDAGCRNDYHVRVISSGGISCGIDASLFLVSELVGIGQAHLGARIMEYAWRWA